MAKWGFLHCRPQRKFRSKTTDREEEIIYADIDFMTVIEERQNFDYSGHYSRFDIFNDPLKKNMNNSN